MPAVDRTELPAAVEEGLAQPSCSHARVGLSLANGRLIFRVKVVPVSGGVTLLWQDITERTRTEAALKHSEERLAVAAECANDGFWEWDFAGEQFYVPAAGERWWASTPHRRWVARRTGCSESIRTMWLRCKPRSSPL